MPSSSASLPPLRVAVLGAGVSGLTSALLLRALGCETTVYAEHHFGDDAPVTFASAYPAASIIPHSVTIRDLPGHQRASHAFFDALREDPSSGVRKQQHYEVFEEPPPVPPYLPAMRDVVMLPDDGSGEPGAPRRPAAEGIFGWHFRCYFAETPIYLPYLARLYRSAGGAFVRGRLTRSALGALSEDVLINAAGYGASELFDDPAPHVLLRGHLVHAAVPQMPHHPLTGDVFSYNYQPTADVYAHADGRPADVYCYPRRDGWVLGGSRQHGRLAPDGAWQGGPATAPTCHVDGQPVPAPILTLNGALLRHLLDLDVTAHPLRTTIGCRYVRDPEHEGVRLEAEERGGRLVLHNYGHGGAGVALSWSCALAMARLLRARRPLPTASPPARPILAAVARTARRLLDD